MVRGSPLNSFMFRLSFVVFTNNSTPPVCLLPVVNFDSCLFSFSSNPVLPSIRCALFQTPFLKVTVQEVLVSIVTSLLMTGALNFINS